MNFYSIVIGIFFILAGIGGLSGKYSLNNKTSFFDDLFREKNKKKVSFIGSIIITVLGILAILVGVFWSNASIYFDI